MKVIIGIAAVAALITVTSCNKSFLDVNDNPNQITTATPKALLPNTTVGMAYTVHNDIGKACGLLMQYTAGISGYAAAYDRWNLGALDGQWTYEIYTNVLNNLRIIIEKTKGSSPAYSGVAKLQLAYIMSVTTDLWGDVPYSQAAQGFGEDGLLMFPQPRFDSQKDIYLGNNTKGIQSLFALVREGLADIASASATKPGADDVVYGGDLAKWNRFGNSLLMKFAIQVSNVAPDTTSAVLSDIVIHNKPFINAIDGSLDFNVPFTTANPNPYYLQDVGGSIPNTQMLSERFLAFERALNDSLRLSKLFIKPGSVYVGYENGSSFAAPAPSVRSYYGVHVLGATRRGDAPLRVNSAFRNYFILAEAALRFGVPGDPNTYFQNGIRAAMRSVGLTDLEISNYFAANPTIVNLTGTTENMLEQIIAQKYVASVGSAFESYNDFRRTGYPKLLPPMNTEGDDPTVFPQRFPYATAEAASNPNQPNPRPKTSVKVWWSK